MSDDVEPPAHLAHLKGMDLVRRTLEEARAPPAVKERMSAAAGAPSRAKGRGHQSATVVGSGPGFARPAAARIPHP